MKNKKNKKIIVQWFVSDSCEELSDAAQKMVAVAVIFIVVLVNCASVKLSTRFLTIFSFGKVLSLTIIIFGGIVMLCQGEIGWFVLLFHLRSTSGCRLIMYVNSLN